MAEVLSPARLDISAEFARGFAGMTDTPVTLDDLLRVREDLVGNIVGQMPQEHRRFLLSVKRSQPDWALLRLPGAKDLPAVRWKLDNLARLNDSTRTKLLAGLAKVLEIRE
jgi:hypothetical protein